MIELSKDMDPVILLDYLLDRQIVEKQPTTCEIEVPGEGNMNVVLRLRYDDRSVIIKQSKPFVRKYPAIAAPLERLLTEARYYQYCQDVESIRTMSPGLLHIDPDNFILVLEDLGEGSDLTSAYQLSSQLTQSDVEHLINYISALHSLEWSESQIAEFPENLKLRKLNHQHIFVLPYRSDNGFDLDSVQPGLAKVASQYIDKEAVMRKATELGELYLGPGKILLHGDYYPGSWLRTREGIKVIDPEFSFMGLGEFDLSVFLAHGMMARMDQKYLLRSLQTYYHPWTKLDSDLVEAFAGIEIFRRIIGLAQLPLDLSLVEKTELLEQAYHMAAI